MTKVSIAAPANIFLCDLLVGKLTKDEQQICLEISNTEAHIAFFIYFVIASLSHIIFCSNIVN
jgi:hypothetical protein